MPRTTKTHASKLSPKVKYETPDTTLSRTEATKEIAARTDQMRGGLITPSRVTRDRLFPVATGNRPVAFPSSISSPYSLTPSDYLARVMRGTVIVTSSGRERA